MDMRMDVHGLCVDMCLCIDMCMDICIAVHVDRTPLVTRSSVLLDAR